MEGHSKSLQLKFKEKSKLMHECLKELVSRKEGVRDGRPSKELTVEI